ncbi:MAG: DUF494 family protein [Candidatus Kapaibacteriales bacterium]
MERLVDLLVFFVTELQTKNEIDETSIKVLVNKGYSRNEISIALSWIIEKLEETQKSLWNDFSGKTQSFRYLHSAEKELFTLDGWNELNQLYMLGILDLGQVEMFIDRLMMVGIKGLDSDAVKRFVSVLIFEQYSSTHLKNLLDNDTIN